MTFSEQINRLFEQEEWAKARRLLEARLKDEPNNHWLLTRLGTTYYEERDYKKALELSQKAIKIAPDCPLVLWDFASTQEMLGDDAGAIRTYAKLFKMTTKEAPNEECWEGMHWEGEQRSLSLLADCFYSVAGCLHRLGQRDKALWFIQEYLEWRAAGVKSIYSAKEVRGRVMEILGSPLSDAFEERIGEAGRQLEFV
jgi:tetratricopeptide (TPR) repeat protein